MGGKIVVVASTKYSGALWFEMVKHSLEEVCPINRSDFEMVYDRLHVVPVSVVP